MTRIRLPLSAAFTLLLSLGCSVQTPSPRPRTSVGGFSSVGTAGSGQSPGGAATSSGGLGTVGNAGSAAAIGGRSGTGGGTAAMAGSDGTGTGGAAGGSAPVGVDPSFVQPQV